MSKKTVALTGSSGTMGFQGFLELYAKKDQYNIVVLNRDSAKNRKKFEPYMNDPSVRFVWGDLTNYEDVLKMVTGADYVLHVGGMVSPAADYYPVKTLKTNVAAAENIVKAVKAQPDPDAVKVVYIGTVAETGDRNPPIHWARTGDPIKISIYDHYAISKVKAEAVFAESGLKHWVSLRQSGILYPEILKNMDPIMFHVPINGVLEWATVEDSGRLLANVCGDDIPEEFWRRFYNIGSGEEYRLTNYEFEELLLHTLGIGSTKKLFNPNWFITRNFHGQWYYDSDVLEEYCHFRANIPVKQYYKNMMNKVEAFYKLAFFAKPFAAILKDTWMKKIASEENYGTLWWVKNNVPERISAYYGSMEEYKKLPKKWSEFDIVIPSKKKTSDEVIILDHGYDETKPFDSLTIEDLQKAAEFRGGKCLATEIVDMYTPVKWVSARGHEFEMSPNLVLKGGHWCPEELPWPWDYDTEAKINPFFAQVWYPLHSKDEHNYYGAEIFNDFKEKVSMKVFMIGGTGLLGSEAARIFIERGHEVKSVALPPLPEGALIPEKMDLEFCNIYEKTDDEIREMLRGYDCFVFAAGIDERVEFPAPVYDAYYKYNIAPLKRILPLCKEVGVKKAVILGSYFSYLAKNYPELKATEKHPYIRSRIDQEEVAFSFADDNFDVSVLELPYIFGTQPGRKPVWVILIEQIKMMDKLPFTMYPKGGTAMLTVRQVGEVIVGAAEKSKGAKAWPISMYNMTWKEFLKIVYAARGMGENRKILSVAPWMMRMGLGKVKKEYAEKGIESGIDVDGLADIMDINLFMDTKYSRELGATDDDIRAAIFDSIKVSQAVYDGEVELLGMKGE